MKRFQTVRFVLPVVLMIFVLVLFTQWRRYSPAPPRLDSPSVSNGFTLHKIREMKDYPLAPYVVVLTPPWLPEKTLARNGFTTLYAPEDAFRVVAIASTGARWNLGWHLETNFQDPDLPDRQLLVTEIPRFYPASYEWIDIEIQNKRGRAAKWRVTGLSKGVRTVVSAKDVHRTYAADGLFIYAHGRIIKGSYKSWVPVQGATGFYAVARPDAAHYWKIVMVKQELEWAAPRSNRSQISGSYWSITASEEPNASLSYAKSFAPNGGFGLQIPYPPDNRFAHLTLRVEKYASSSDSGGTLISSRIIELTCLLTVEDLTHLKPKTPTGMARD